MRKIFQDEISGAKGQQPGPTEALTFMRRGDTLVVWRLDRLGRALKDLLHRIEKLQQQGIQFRSLHESIDTISPGGKFQLHVFSALAEFERDLISERTMAGLRTARARGRLGGRRKEMTTDKVEMAARPMKDPHVSAKNICKMLGVSRSTLYWYISPSGKVR